MEELEDGRSAQERADDEAFEQLLAGPFGQVRASSQHRRSVSLLSSSQGGNSAEPTSVV